VARVCLQVGEYLQIWHNYSCLLHFSWIWCSLLVLSVSVAIYSTLQVHVCTLYITSSLYRFTAMVVLYTAIISSMAMAGITKISWSNWIQRAAKQPKAIHYRMISCSSKFSICLVSITVLVALFVLGMTLNCIHIFIVTGSFLYWCVMRPASKRFFIHGCIYRWILIISYLATFLGTNSLYVLMCRKAVNQSI